MHELPATQGMLQVALDAAASVGASRIREIHLVIGDLSSMVDDSVQFYFDLLSRDTIAEGAVLVFQREACVLNCTACGYSAPVKAPLPPQCPGCEDLRIRVTGGDAFRVDSIEVDEPETTESHSPSSAAAPAAQAGDVS